MCVTEVNILILQTPVCHGWPWELARLAAAGTPTIAIDRISRELAEVVKLPDVVKRLYGAAVEPIGGGPSDLGKALEREIEVMARAVQAAQLKAE